VLFWLSVLDLFPWAENVAVVNPDLRLLFASNIFPLIFLPQQSAARVVALRAPKAEEAPRSKERGGSYGRMCSKPIKGQMRFYLL